MVATEGVVTTVGVVTTEGMVASTGEGMEVEEEDVVVLGDGDKVQGMKRLEKHQLRMTHMNQHAIIVLLCTSTTTTIISRCDYVCMLALQLIS